MVDYSPPFNPTMSYVTSYPDVTSGTRRAEGYSAPSPTSLPRRRRRRFICAMVFFVLANLCVALCFTLIPGPGGLSTVSTTYRLAGEFNDTVVWCISNCSRLENSGWSSQMRNYSDVTGKQEFCCVEKRNSLANIYEKYEQAKYKSGSLGKNKTFDGVRVRDAWMQDSRATWPRLDKSSSYIHYRSENQRRFSIQRDAIFYVSTQLRFTCHRNPTQPFSYYHNVTAINGHKRLRFRDERVEVAASSSAPSTADVIFSFHSSLNVMVEMESGGELRFDESPAGCDLHRTVVIYNTRDRS